jgi:hypothetical protein
MLLLLIVRPDMVRPDWPIFCSSPGTVVAVDGDPAWDVISSPHLVLLLLCSSPSAVAADDGETFLGYDLLLT